MPKTVFPFSGLFFFSGLLILAVCVGACSGARKDIGYYRTSQVLSNDSTDTLKAKIKAISNDLFEPLGYTGSNEIAIRYRLLRPAAGRKASDSVRQTGDRKTGDRNAGPNRNKGRYPLILVLHGSGAVGTDNVAQLGILVKLWAQPRIRERYPAYVVAPQMPRRSSNYSPDKDNKMLVSTPDPCLTTALQLIDSLKKVLPVDESKIYVIGFSMGASGVINSLALRPDLFAAAVSISGIPELDRTEVLAHIPLWLVHGKSDTENPIPSDSLLFKQLKAVKGNRVRYWEVDHLEHDIYYRLYTSEVLPEWLFRHRK